LVPLENSLIRLFNGLIFYLLLPLAMTLFAWKAAVFPAWGSALLCVAVGVIASHGGPSVLEVVDDFDGDTLRAVYTVRFDRSHLRAACIPEEVQARHRHFQTELDLINARFRRAKEDYERWQSEKPKSG
jgi:hypothetical protein